MKSNLGWIESKEEIEFFQKEDIHETQAAYRNHLDD